MERKALVVFFYWGVQHGGYYDTPHVVIWSFGQKNVEPYSPNGLKGVKIDQAFFYFLVMVRKSKIFITF